MSLRLFCTLPALLGMLSPICLFAQAEAAAGSDVLIFKNGEKLIGHLRSATAAKVIFVSDSAGSVTVDWSKVQELRSGARFAAIPKNVTLHGQSDAEKAPRGTLAMKDQKLEITPSASSAAQTLAVSEVADVIGEKQFNDALEPRSFWKDWTGHATLGASVLRGTQDNTSINSMLTLQRSTPSVGWLPARGRTIVNFTSTYGKFSTEGSDPVKTIIYRGDLEQDFFLSPRVYLLAGAMYEHNYMQGLNLMQGYGGGFGFVIRKEERDHLELRLGAGFTDQRWTDPALNHQFLGARIGESYSHTFNHGVVFALDAGVRPALTYTKAFFGGYTASLTVPVYKRFALNMNSFDTFVYNPPPFFRKNAFQMSFGASYVIR